MVGKRRSHRGNGAAMFSATDGDEHEEAPEDAYVVVDSEGNPIGDDEPAHVETEEEVHAGDEPEPDAADPLATLQQNYDRLQEEAAETKRRLAESENQLHAQADDGAATTKALIASTKAAAKAALDAAKRQVVEAGQAGDFEALAEAQTVVGEKSAELREISQIEREFERQSQTQQQKPQQPQKLSHTEAVEKYINEQLTGPQQQFVRKHYDTIFPEGDGKPLQTVVALANVAALRYGKDTPEFFDYIEREMNLSEPDNSGRQPPAQQQQTGRKPAPQKRPSAAPVSRSNGGAPRQVTLTAEQINAAKAMGMTPKRYAMYVQRAKDGANDPNYRGPRFSQDDPAIVGNRR